MKSHLLSIFFSICNLWHSECVFVLMAKIVVYTDMSSLEMISEKISISNNGS